MPTFRHLQSFQVNTILDIYIDLSPLRCNLVKNEKLQLSLAAAKSEIDLINKIINSMPGVFYVIDNNAHFLLWNENLLNILQYSAEELSFANALDLFEGDEIALIDGKIKEAFLIGKAEANASLVSKSGTRTPFRFNGVRCYIQNEPIVIGMGIDISDQKQIEQDLKIAAVAFDINEAVAITDANNIIVKVNKAFTQLTGYDSTEVIGKSPKILKSGHHDRKFYEDMWASIQSHHGWSGEIWDKRKDGSVYPKKITIRTVLDENQKVLNYVSVFSDISSIKETQERINNLAFYDELTKLPNRQNLMRSLSMKVSTQSENYHAVIFMDLDNFKTFNDTKGHAFGDQILVKSAARLLDCLREGDIVSRIGGDEFVIIISDLSLTSDHAKEQLEIIVRKLQAAINEHLDINGYECYITASIGICIFRPDEAKVDELLMRADTAMYQAKYEGRNTFKFFESNMLTNIEKRASIEEDLRFAVERDEFALYLQLQVDENEKAVAAEALIRWIHPSRGLVLPDEFIPVAESSGAMAKIGSWVLRKACAYLVNWESDPEKCLLQIAVNVSYSQFKQSNFVENVLDIIKETKANPKRLKIEFTESLVLDNIDDGIKKINQLRDAGIGLSLDDFGTGYSSLSYLKKLPINQLKIDRSFIRDIMHDINDEVIVRTIIAMANSMDLDVVAEGVETREQFEKLKKHSGLKYQGYLFGRPLPFNLFETTLAR
jgi:diguanylate cyclase (GGDEF)-like protein/PAS domain S-box-containing protein